MANATPAQPDLRAVAAETRPDAFIRYARDDKPIVEEIASGLAARGKKVRVDWEDIPFSASWEERARAGIEASRAVSARYTSGASSAGSRGSCWLMGIEVRGVA